MEFVEKIKQLGEKATAQKELLHTEEATKNALIMPFIVALGYDVFDPAEVVPEYVADVGMKKGEKVDYVLMANGIPQIIVECKKADCPLQAGDKAQLHRYFGVLPDVRFGILTNGVVYQFYSDIDTENIMDGDPFLELDLSQVQESSIESLRRFSKGRFNPENAIGTATNLKYMTQIKKVLESEYKDPSPEFVRLCIQNVHAGPKTQAVVSKFTGIVKLAFNQLVNDEVSHRLKLVFEGEKDRDENGAESEEAKAKVEHEPPLEFAMGRPSRVVTTEEEVAAVDLIKDLVAEDIVGERVAMRDQISYCGVLLDDNNRKPICRLHFNQEQKSITLFSKDDDGGRKENRVEIGSIEEIATHKDALLAACAMYEKG